MQNYIKLGKKWAFIAGELKKRSQHAIKNRFYHLMAKFLSCTNREVIKSKRDFIQEATNLFESLRKEEKLKLAEKLIKKEENIENS